MTEASKVISKRCNIGLDLLEYLSAIICSTERRRRINSRVLFISSPYDLKQTDWIGLIEREKEAPLFMGWIIGGKATYYVYEVIGLATSHCKWPKGRMNGSNVMLETWEGSFILSWSMMELLVLILNLSGLLIKMPIENK